MKRAALITCLLCLSCASAVSAQEPRAEQPGGPSNQAHSNKEESFAEKHELELKWANFLVLAGLLGYLIGKNAGPFFASRSEAIRKDMEDSRRQREEAEARAKAVELRLANLETDLAALRSETQAEAAAEEERAAARGKAEIAKIEAHAQQEIASAGKAARMDLKRYAAGLAVGLAEQKVRARMTPAAEDSLVQGFVRNLR
jgi:F-type H+-transporting ATPase subunit b